MDEHRLLIVDDEEEVRFPVRRFFEKRGFVVVEAGSAAEARERFEDSRPDVALLDFSLPDEDGLELLRELHATGPDVPLLMLTAHGSIDLAVRAMKEGAEQFFTKPVELQALLVVVERALDNRRLRHVHAVRQTRRARSGIDPFLGESPAIVRLREHAQRVASSGAPALILGETGSGKGVLARWLHESSPRAREAFVDLNCAGLSRELLESELFGYQKGAFTGAVASKAGLMEMAHHGTLFLDEIGEMEPVVQAKLLKAVEEMRLRRLGDVTDRQVSFRLIAATHRDLAAAVAEGRFRDDLYFRIRGVPLRIPPLRERGDDILLLARYFLGRASAEIGRGRVQLTDDALELLRSHAWPGNLRELRNVLEQAVLLSPGDRLTPEDLGEWLHPPRREAAPARDTAKTLQEVEREHIVAVLAAHPQQVAKAAEVLGISRTALYERIRKHGIELPRGRR